ncbi:glycosyltransferase family 4 protein [Enterococcus viikkiensis]|uniref:Glycosyltransferase family 4 protein n=1 Tax=Enterococcus viikkiensis TaxID=930854 RepID=A0ABU3FMK4_9ENTE|nr:glycosyltransferase family 4 protein [Enterococcus viikkiensis]
MKILYVTTISNTMNAFLIPHIKMLLDEGHKVSIACSIEQPLDTFFIKNNVPVYDIPFDRKPNSLNNYQAYRKFKNVMRNGKFDLVHTHTPIASMLVRLVCRKEKAKVFYTAHGFHFYQSAPLINWLLFYPVEKFLSKYTDVLITINQEDYNLAKNKFKMKKLFKIPGIGLNFERLEITKSREKLREELQVNLDKVVLISIGEINKNKNHKIVIDAIYELQNYDLEYWIVGEGVLKSELEQLCEKYGLKEKVKFLGYRSNIADILNAADIFLFPSKREGLGMAALEAMYMGLPVIGSNVHGIKDYLSDNTNGFLVNPEKKEDFVNRILSLMNNKDLRGKMGENNREASLNYSINESLKYMNSIYSRVSSRKVK